MHYSRNDHPGPGSLYAVVTVRELLNSHDALVAALKRFYDSDGCGDYCSNACPHCEARAALKLAGAE